MTEDNIAVPGLAQGIEGLALNIKDMEEDSDLRSFSGIIEARITSLQQSANKAHDSFNAERQKLYREDGQQKYSPVEHKEIEDDLKRQRDETFSELKQRTDKLSAEVSTKLEVTAKPERYLSDEEMTRANGRRDFVREDVDRLPLGEVPGLLREAELTGDRVDRWLAARYATIRADRELEKLREGGASAGDVRAEDMSRQMREVREGAERLQEKLQLPGSKLRKQNLEALRQQTVGLKSHVRDKALTHEERVALSSGPFH